MRIVCIGGGPAGLYFGLLMKGRNPAYDVTVVERNRPYDTFGWGVVFSDQTLGNLRAADAPSADAILDAFNHWDDIEINFRGRQVRSSGHGFCGIGRKRLLNILQARCEELGVKLVFETQVTDDTTYEADLIIACDGANSAIRQKYTATYKPAIDMRDCRFVWLGTKKLFDAFTFAFEETEFGWFQAHAYRFDDQTSTFIVETPERVWRAAGLDEMSKEDSIAFCEKLFAKYLDGNPLLSNAAHLRGSSQWIRFPRVVNEEWVHWRDNADGTQTPIVLMGDAAHTAHFSIGSGTKLAMEDALALAACLHEQPDIETALSAYEIERRPVVESTQRAAQASLEWFENIGMYADQEPTRFCFNLLTRSRRITYANLRTRDPEFADRVDAAFAKSQNLDTVAPAMFQPFRLGALELKNRVIVSPMDMYSAVDGVPGDFHLVHLGSKAMGGAGLVMTEMVCVSPEARITPGCGGLWTDEQRDAWTRIVSYVHDQSTARIGLQLGHAGRKGSTCLMWEGMDDPLPEGNWPLISPSPLPYGPASATPREATRAELDRVIEDFVSAARRGAEAGFDLLELHCAHGYLLSSFLSPITNQRTDEFGGSLENRLRFPLKVFDAVRAAWPADRPMIVRISATDWLPDGNTEHDAVEIARAFIAHGADAIDVSSGQIAKHERPAFGRSYQTPFADRIRHEVAAATGTAVIAVGAIASYDDVNSILLAGRADLCALGRTHLYDPQWTLHAAAEQEYRGAGADWPLPYQAGRRKPPTSRTDAVRPRLALLREESPDQQQGLHLRWRPSPAPAHAV